MLAPTLAMCRCAVQRISQSYEMFFDSPFQLAPVLFGSPGKYVVHHVIQELPVSVAVGDNAWRNRRI